MGWVQKKQRIIRAKSDVEALGMALDRYRVANGTYPVFDPANGDLSSYDNIKRGKKDITYEVEKKSSEALFLALTGWNNWKGEKIDGVDYEQRERFIELEDFDLWAENGRKDVIAFEAEAGKNDPSRPQYVFLSDPWRQPYLYKYPVLTKTEGDNGNSGVPKFSRREDFIVLSKGPDEKLNSKANTEYGPGSWMEDEDAGLDTSIEADLNLDNISVVGTPPM